MTDDLQEPQEPDLSRAREVACYLRNVFPLDGVHPVRDGETPHLVEVDTPEEQRARGVDEDDVDVRLHSIEVHAGCGCEGPEVMAVVPYDSENGGPSLQVAEAIRDAGQLLGELLDALAESRAALAAEQGLPEGGLPGWRWTGNAWIWQADGVCALIERVGGLSPGWTWVVAGLGAEAHRPLLSTKPMGARAAMWEIRGILQRECAR